MFLKLLSPPLSCDEGKFYFLKFFYAVKTPEDSVITSLFFPRPA